MPILKHLADGQFHSGEVIANTFNISRASVWKVMQHISAMGVRVDAVRGRGYRLPKPVHLLQKTQVLHHLASCPQPFHLQIHPVLDSTNTYLMQHGSHLPHATCVVAELQTQGRGRRGRAWVAGLGASLTFSLLWRFQCGVAGLSGLSLAVGVAIMRTLITMGVSHAQLKWPNDVLICRTQPYAKLAGVLIELQGDMEGASTAVIGIGLNMALPASMVDKIDQTVTDLSASLGHLPDPNLTLACLLTHLADVLTVFESQGFAALREEWRQAHVYQGRTVQILMPDAHVCTGVVVDVADDGVLLVQTAQGVQRFASGEISLRPMQEGT